MNEPKTVGVIVGRFQTPELHIGHRSLIENVMARHDKVLIVLGSSPAILTKDNPLNVAARSVMIKGMYPTVDISVIEDRPSDIFWSAELDQLLATKYPTHTPILYGNRDSFVLSYHGIHEYRRLTETVTASATEQRKAILLPEDNPSFRRGMIYASYLPYATSYQAVDVAVINKNKVLMGGKAIDEGKYRFIGGFVDPNDRSLEHAARREVCEEVGHIETGEYKYLGSYRIDDYRYRKTEHKVMSALFATPYIFGAPVATDDLDYCDWVSADHMVSVVVPHHMVLCEAVYKYMKGQ